MRRSTDKILTTHVGSLPDFVALDPNAPDHEAKLRALVADAVTKQRATGLDIINEGEFAKYGDWLRYAESRLGGCEPRKVASTVFIEGKDREEFAAFYKYATERGTLFYRPNEDLSRGASFFACTAPITYQGQAAMAREIEVFRAALGAHPRQDAFLTTTAPASLEPYRKNEFYKSEEEFVYAIADAMRIEYQMIAQAGFLVQVDDAWIPALWDRIGIKMGLAAFKNYCLMRVEALNHALKGIAPEQIRYHFCWGSWHGPHVYDIAMADIVDVMLRVNAQCYLFEAANPRHEHEYVVWESVKLPRGQDHRARHGDAFDRRGRAPGARLAAHPALCETGRQGERDGGRRLRVRPPQPSADRLGQTKSPGRRRRARHQGAEVFVAR